MAIPVGLIERLAGGKSTKIRVSEFIIQRRFAFVSPRRKLRSLLINLKSRLYGEVTEIAGGVIRKLINPSRETRGKRIARSLERL